MAFKETKPSYHVTDANKVLIQRLRSQAELCRDIAYEYEDKADALEQEARELERSEPYYRPISVEHELDTQAWENLGKAAETTTDDILHSLRLENQSTPLISSLGDIGECKIIVHKGVK